MLQNKYRADIFAFNPQNAAAANQQANAWVSGKTNNKIKELSLPISAETMLTLLNATYFLAAWNLAFDEKSTRKKNLITLHKTKQQKDFMYKRGQLKYYETPGLQALQLPYEGDTYSMLLIVPDTKQGLSAIENKMSATQLDSIIAALRYTDVKLFLPKFKITSETMPRQSPAIAAILGAKADFSLIDPLNRNLAGAVAHKTFIEIDERKTEAAALTEVIVIGYGGHNYQPPPPKVVDADHPFLFFVIDNSTHTIAFMGRYTGD